MQGDDHDSYELFVETPISERFSALGVMTEYDALHAELAGKAVLFRDEQRVAALQAGAFWTDTPDWECQDYGGEARGLYGWSGDHGLFVNLELAHRIAGDCVANRGEVTLGWRPPTLFSGRLLTMAQVFTNRDRYGETQLTGQVSAVLFDQKGRGVQVGIRLSDEAPALVVGVWDVVVQQD